MTQARRQERILVIKLGAMGDIVQATGPFAAIRRHHADDHIVLLTTRPFLDFATAGGWFDEVWTDERPKWWQVRACLASLKRVRTGRFDRIYDLQTSDRTAILFHLLGPGRRPQWSGIVRGCSHRHANPRRDLMHTVWVAPVVLTVVLVAGLLSLRPNIEPARRIIGPDHEGGDWFGLNVDRVSLRTLLLLSLLH